jgi:hypothetical protein
MHLIVGHLQDSCCAALLKRVASEGFDVRLIEAPLDAPALHSLQVEPDGRASTVRGSSPGLAEPIESLFLRASGTIDPAGWDAADHAYMQAEIQATMLAWISALDCPVVNRVGAELWYRPRLPLLHWLAPLRASGLRSPDTIVTNDGEEISRFRKCLEDRAAPGAVLTSLARHETWLVAPDEWPGVLGLSRHGPVCLSEPHGTARSLCVVGDEVIWDRHPSSMELALAPRLLRFAQLTGLQFVELAVAQVHDGPAVVHIDPLPRLENFAGEAQDCIIGALADLLVGRTLARIVEACP